jgi:hypothetical protein
MVVPSGSPRGFHRIPEFAELLRDRLAGSAASHRQSLDGRGVHVEVQAAFALGLQDAHDPVAVAGMIEVRAV